MDTHWFSVFTLSSYFWVLKFTYSNFTAIQDSERKGKSDGVANKNETNQK